RSSATRPPPAAAGRWTWHVLACCAQLRLARDLAEDIRMPWPAALPAWPPHPGPRPPRVPCRGGSPGV
ncbi:MAG TPA: hypothetical protein VNF47_26980, partial [Streptosporangiaceae bacterium]|nr:hypothetical protein [Streptosporangiaceae bacterium]